MENNQRKSKAFIITFIAILILLLVGYYLYKNSDKIIGTKGSNSISKIFSPLLGNSKTGTLNVINEPTTTTNTTPTVVTTIDQNGNKIVLAEAGEDLKKGDVVYVASFNQAGKPIVMKAIANDKKKSLVLGVAAEDILKGQTGNIIVEGQLIGIPTNKKELTLWAISDPLYLSDVKAGGMLKTAPKAPSFKVDVGCIVKVDPTDGIIQIGDEAKCTNMASSKNLNTGLLHSSDVDGILNYWGEVFGSDSYKGIVFGDVGDFDFSGYKDGDFIWNPIDTPTKNPETNEIKDNTIETKKQCSDGIDNDVDGKIDEKDPGCLDDYGKYIKTKDSEFDSTTTVNQCLLIEENPLEFTDAEKSQLSTLLRKFYLISSTLKTSDDISTIYNEIDQQKIFVNQIKDLTKQCYAQVDPLMATYGWVRHGNPWYTANGTGGNFPYTTTNTGYTQKGTVDDLNIPAIERLLNIW